MLDFRIKTFLELCRLKNYTKTAQYLHITQPAVTQHIQYLEREYGTPLFDHEAHRFTLTPQGEQFYWWALSMEASSRKIRELVCRPISAARQYRFGVTLSIGEYVMPEILTEYLKKYTDRTVSMIVENTDSLMRKLDEGEIDFAIIEGSFDKNRYSHVLFSNERFITVGGQKGNFPAACRTLDELTVYPLVIRERGSGTRMIFETILKEHNLSLDQFRRCSEVGNFKTIKRLVQEGLGITFAYELVVREEIEKGILREIPVSHVTTERELNFIYLKDHILEKEYLEFCDFCMEVRHQQDDRQQKEGEG